MFKYGDGDFKGLHNGLFYLITSELLYLRKDIFPASHPFLDVMQYCLCLLHRIIMSVLTERVIKMLVRVTAYHRVLSYFFPPCSSMLQYLYGMCYRIFIGGCTMKIFLCGYSTVSSLDFEVCSISPYKILSDKAIGGVL